MTPEELERIIFQAHGQEARALKYLQERLEELEDLVLELTEGPDDL